MGINAMNAKNSKRGVFMSLLVLVLFLLMLSEIMAFVFININYNNIAKGNTVFASAQNYALAAKLGSVQFAKSNLEAALKTLMDFEMNASLRKTVFINNFTYMIGNLMISGELPNVTATSAGANMLMENMGNITFSAYNAMLINSLAAHGISANITETRPVIFQESPFTLSVKYTESLSMNTTSGTYSYSIPVQATIPLNGTADPLEAQQGVFSPISFASPSQLPIVGAEGDLVSGSYYESPTASVYAVSGSPSFAYGTVIYSGPSSCAAVEANVISPFNTAPMNHSIIIVTSNAVNITGLNCQIGNNVAGVISNTINVQTTPNSAYLVYSGNFALAGAFKTGMKVLLYGPGLDAINLDGNNGDGFIESIANGKFFPSKFMPSYIDRADNNIGAESSHGIFKISGYNTQSAYFDGNGNIIIPHSQSLALTGNFALSWWFNPSLSQSVKYDEEMVNSRCPTDTTFDMQLISAGYNSGVYGLHGDVGTGTGTWLATDINYQYVFSNNTWYNVAVDIATSGWSLYLNGNEVSSGSYSGTPSLTDGNSNIYLGECGTLPSTNFNGNMANLQIYGSSLSSYNISRIYSRGIDGLPLNTNSLAAWYPFNGNTTDESGNGNNGIPVNTIFKRMPSYNGDSINGGNPANNTMPIPGVLGCDSFGECTNQSLPHLYGTSTMPASALQQSLQVAKFSYNKKSYIPSFSPQINTASGDYNTVSFWMFWNQSIAGNTRPFGFNVYSLVGCGMECTPPVFGFNTDNGDYYGISTASVNGLNDHWVNVVAEFYNGYYTGNSFIYINGTKQTLVQTIGTGQGAISTPYYTIGNWGLLGNYWNGDIANLQIYNGSLNSNQISTLYKEGITGLPLNDGSLAAWYPLNGNARDYSGSGNDGLAYNVTFPYFYLAGYTPGSNQVLSELTSIFNIANIFQLFGLTTPTPLGNGQYHVVVTLTNTQSLPTPVPFQQMVTVDSATYSNYEDTNLDNVYFSYANGTIIPSWLESCSSTCSTSGSSSTSTVYWLKLNKPIPAGGEMLIYMSFAPKGVNMFNGKTIGEAPQLSSTYAQYDDGASVFLAYFNMQNNPISSSHLGTSYYSITTTTGPNGVNQPLLTWTGTTGQDFDFINLASTLPSNYIITDWVKSDAQSYDIGLGAGSTTAGEWDGYVVDPGANTNVDFNLWKITGTTFGVLTSVSYSQSASTWYTLEFQYVSGGSMTGWVEPWQNTLDASSSSNKVTGSDTTYTSFNAIELFPYSGSTSDITSWALMVARAYPPNGVMPSVNFGLVGS